MERLHLMEGYRVAPCCALLGFSRQAYYKQAKERCKQTLQEDLTLQAVCDIRRELPVLGGRKLFHLLKQRLPVELLPGRDAFFCLLRQNELLIRKRRNVHPVTTVSWHRFHTYRNLYQGRIPSGSNLVWVADITYIRMVNGTFLYLSLLTDAYSHKIVGWNLSDSLNLEGALCALKGALDEFPHPTGLTHHSDRGIQYCSNEYTGLLKKTGIQISMTENGDPKENAVAERVNGILKEEWLNRECIVSLQQGQKRIGEIIEVYNTKRPHLSIDYLTPQQAHEQQGELTKKWKTYYKRKEYVTE